MKLQRLLLALLLCLFAHSARGQESSINLQDILNPDGTIREGASGSFKTDGYTMRTGPNGQPIFMSSGNGWAGLSSGINGVVRAVVVSGDDVYIGGNFNQIGEFPNALNANGVARYNLQTGTWSALGTGVSGEARALALSGNILYVGGNFTSPGSYIAQWNIQTQTWSGLGALNNSVWSIAVSGTNVFVGGEFTMVGSTTVNRIARYSTQTQTWSAMGTGALGTVFSLTISGSTLYAGSSPFGANQIGTWTIPNGPWSNVGNAFNAAVWAIAVVGSDVYAGGQFTQNGSTPTGSIARFNTVTQTWSSLSFGLGTVLVIRPSGNELLVGGIFTNLGFNYIARYNTQTQTWSGFGSGADNTVTSIAQTGNFLLVGGNMTTIDGVTVNRLGAFVSPIAPSVSLLTPTNVTPTSATLNGRINPNAYSLTQAQFELALDPTFTNGLQTINTTPNASGIGSGLGFVNVSASVTLQPNAFYYYRLRATNSTGTTLSPVQTFFSTVSPEGLQMWLRADTLITESGGLITNWGDLSGNNRNAISSGLFRPLYVASGSDFGNRPCVSFGTVGGLRFGYQRISNIRTAIIVGRSNTANRLQFLLGDSTTADFHPTATNLVDATNAAVAVRNGLVFLNGQQFNATAAPRPLSPAIMAFQTTANATASTIANDRQATNNTGWVGEIAEVIIYNRVLSASERSQIETYLSQRYGINSSATMTSPTNISTTTATLNGQVTPNGLALTQALFEYSTDPTFATNVQTANTTPNAGSIGTGFLPVNVSATVTIQPNLTYFTRLRIVNANGTVFSNNAATFHIADSQAPSPNPLPQSGLQLWLRADRGTTRINGLVARWADLSGNNRDGVSVEAVRPTFVASETNYDNQPVINFGNVGDRQLGFRRINDLRTAFVVARSTAPTTFQFLLGDSTTFQFHPSNTNLVDATNAAAVVRDGMVFLNGQQFAATAAARPSSPTIIMFETTGNAITSTIANDRNLTGNRSWRGEVAEVIIYNRVLSVAERAQVQSYLAQRYNIGVQSTSATPSVAANTLGTFVLGSTGVTVTFTTASTTAGSLSGSVTNSRPNVVGSLPTGIVNLAERFWTITQTNLTGFNCALTFNLSTLGGIQNFNALKVLRRSNSSSPWVDVETISGVTITRNAPFITVAGITSFSDFVIASDASNQLPVELVEFTGRKTSEGVQLAWRTASELNNSGFEVERKSQGVEWNTLGFVRGNGTTTEAQSYSFLDRTASGKVQYRLKQIDFDGQFEYSPIVEVDAGLPKTFELSQNYPNPFNPTTVISYQLPVASNVSLKVYDVLGKEVMTLVNGRQEAGQYNATVNASALASGVYFYRLQAGNFVSTKKMMLVK